MSHPLQFPTGRFSPAQEPLGDGGRKPLVRRIAGLPDRIRAAVDGLDDAALDTPYRSGGWSPRQIVHHLGDSHLNAFVRFKLALTEDHPTIKPYDQDSWAGLTDSRLPVAPSLALLEGLHARWVALLESMEPGEFARTVNHPEMGARTLDFFLQLYAWHGDHHAAQVEGLRSEKGW